MDRSRPCQPRVCGPPLPAHETVAQKHPSLRVKPLARTQSRQAAAIAHRTPPLFLSDLTRSTHAETRTQRHSPARSTADSRLHFGQPSPSPPLPAVPLRHSHSRSLPSSHPKTLVAVLPGQNPTPRRRHAPRRCRRRRLHGRINRRLS